jgi:hypothetical protein
MQRMLHVTIIAASAKPAAAPAAKLATACAKAAAA